MKGIFKKVRKEEEETPVISDIPDSNTSPNQVEGQFSFNFFEEKDKSSNPSEQQKKKKKKKKKGPSSASINEEDDDDELTKDVASNNVKITKDTNTKTINSQIEHDLVNSLQATSLNTLPPPPQHKSTQPPITSQESKESTNPKKKKNSNKKKKSKSKNDEESEDDDMKFLDSIIEQQKQETQKQKPSKQKQPSNQSNSQSKLNSKNTKGIDSTKGPKFITSNSADVAKLDEQEKLKLKYGQGKNLVAVGPKKIKDPNWLGPPPGLTKVSNSDSRVIRPPEATQSPPIASLTTSNLLKKENNSEIVYHHSPFTFSFTGL